MGCSETTTPTNPGTGGSSSSSSSSSSGATEEQPDAGTSSEGTALDKVQAVFATSCAGSTCHGTGGRGGLKLTDKATSCKSLVGVDVVDSAPVPTCTTGGAAAGKMKRVVAGDPQASFLYLKLLGDQECISVGGKPAGFRMPKEEEPLSAAEIALVEGWIKAGASCD